MTSVWGWAGAPCTPEEAARALEWTNRGAESPGDGGVRSVLPCGGIGASGSQMHFHRDGDDAIVLIGRPRLSGATAPGNPEDAIAQRVLAGYRAAGADVLRALEGSFTLAIIRNGGREALLAIDRMGVGTLSYECCDERLYFGSSGDFLAARDGAAATVDLQSLFNYFYHHMVPGPSTIRSNHRRLPPGGYLVFQRGRARIDIYWKPRYDELAAYDLRALKLEFRTLLRDSVAQLVDGRTPAAFLSGGTDSSTIAGLLGEVTGRPAWTYSIGFDVAGYDEMSYARIAAKHFATDHHEYYVTPDDVVALATRMAAYCDQPFGNASSVPTYYCAMRARADGSDLLLGGDGGDELFGGNERYATQAFLSWYSRVPTVLKKAALEPLLFLPGADSFSLIRKGRSYVRYASMPMPDRLYAYNLLELHSAPVMFTPEFLQRVDVDTPLGLIRDAYVHAAASGQLNRMLALDLRFTLADNDLYKVSSMCGLAGVDVAYPMLNDALVAFSMRLPEALKLKGRKLRYFFKEALRDFLPLEIINKRKHGFGLPIGVWMRSHAPLRDLAYDALDALVARGVVQRSFVAHLMEQHDVDNAAYWGNEIWVLSQLELWLQAHGFPRGQALL